MSFVNFNFAINNSGINETLETNGILGGSSKITIFGLAGLLIYAIIKILNFYGIGIEVYGSYLAFYIFILLASFVLDKYYPKI
jgi:hypothetical protein